MAGASAHASEKGGAGALLAEVDGAVLVYDQGDADTLDVLESWAEQIHGANSAAAGQSWRAGLTAAKTTPNWVPPENPLDPEDNLAPGLRPKNGAGASPSDDDEEGMGGAGALSSSAVRLVLAANKNDLPRAQRKATQSEGAALAYQLRAKFLETSARDSCNVDVAFLGLARKIVADRLAGRNSGGGCTIC